MYRIASGTSHFTISMITLGEKGWDMELTDSSLQPQLSAYGQLILLMGY